MNIDINKTFSVIKGVRQVIPPTPRSIRKMVIPEFLYEKATEHISLLYGIQLNERIFTFTKTRLSVEIKRLTALGNIEPIRIHDLLHSHTSMLINMGINLFEISRRLGHESYKTTSDTYGHLYKNKDAEIAAQIHDLKEK